MFEIIETNKTTTFFIGDVHGEFRAIANWIKNNGLKDCSIIFCGDFGLGFSSPQHEESELLHSDMICEERNVDCYVIRGNHDDPSYYNANVPKHNLKRFKTLSDYTVIQTPEHNILCVGGAISVDRLHRQASYEYDVETLIIKKHYSLEKARKTAKLYWWEKEPFFYNKSVLDEINKCGIKIDVVATHSAPDFCQPTNNPKAIYWSRLDKYLENDINNERQDFTKLYNYLISQGNKIVQWFYGHYHQHNFEIIEGTKFSGLDMGRQSKQGGGPGGNFDMVELI